MIEELIDKQYQSVLGFCRTMTQNDAQAQDLAQETFLRAMQHETQLCTMEPKQQKSWLMRTAKHLFIDQFRKSARESLTDEISPIPVEDESFSCVDMETLLLCLPEQDRVLFVMRYLYGYRSNELAEMFSMPAGTVRTRLHAARKRLKQQLEGVL